MVQEDDEERSSHKNPLRFTGEDESKWHDWSFKMLAYAHKKGYEEAFHNTYTFPKDQDKWSAEDKANKKMQKDAWAQLAHVLESHALQSVRFVTSKDPKEAWDKLKEEFEPNQMVDLISLQEDFGNIKLSSSVANPIEWIEKLQWNNYLQTNINYKYKKDTFLMLSHIYSKLPKDKYESFISSTREQVPNMSLQELKRKILVHWKAFVKEGTEEKEAFYGEQQSGQPRGGKGNHPKKRFKGDCKKCGKQGHKAEDCRSGKSNNDSSDGRSNKEKYVKCFKCHKKGHYSRECPQKKDQDYGLFCGMVSLEEAVEETKVQEITVVEDPHGDEWNMSGLAATLARENMSCKEVGEVHAMVEAPKEQQGQDVVKWLLDTGASLNVEFSENSVTDEKPCDAIVGIADGKKIQAKGLGSKVLVDKKTGFPLKIKQMHVIPEFSKRILSVCRLIDDGYEVHFTTKNAIIKDNSGKQIECPREMPSGLYYLHAKQESVQAVIANETPTWKNVEGDVDATTGIPKNENRATVKMPEKMDINEAHDKCGHKGEVLLRKTYKKLGVELTGHLTACEGCGYAKARAKAVSKTTKTKATKPGERLFLDTTGPFSPTLKGYKYWIQVVDDYTRHGFCEFNKQKTGMGTFIRKIITNLRAMGLETKYLRCDNAGEHLKAMVALCEEFNMQLELTAPDTPQQNGVVERRIVILKQRALAMMIAAGITEKMREVLWCEAADCANDLENISASTVRNVFPVEMMTGKKSKLYPQLQPWGRIGYVTIRKKFKSTWKEKAVKQMMVGYSKNHAADTYKMYNPQTKAISESRDIITWADWRRVDPKDDMSIFKEEPELLDVPMGLDPIEVLETIDAAPDYHLIPDDGDDGAEDTAVEDDSNSEAGRNVLQENTSESMEKEASAYKARKLERELKKLESNLSEKPSMDRAIVIDTDDDGNETSKTVHFVFNTELMTEHGDPKTFWEAMEGPHADLWWDASGKEAMNFIKRGSWRKKLRSEVVKEKRKIIGTKWVYKKKDEQDGSIRYKGRIVSLGYMQIPGVDYTQSFSPVGNDTSVRIVIGLALYHKDWIIEVIDVEAAFLEGDMEKTMYIEWPPGMEHLGFITKGDQEKYCIEQMKSMYGNTDAALIYFRLFRKHLIDVMKMQQTRVDPCVFYKKFEGDVVLVAVCHVDDNAIAGTPVWTKWFKTGVKKRFGITDLGILKKHLGIWYKWKVDEHGERYVVATMPKLVRQIIETMEKAVGHEVKESNVPATPGSCLEKKSEEAESIMETEYRSIVGKAMYLVTKLFVEGANPVRELSKFFTNPGIEHWKALEKFVGYLKKNEKDIRLTYRRPKELRMVSSVDSNYATDKETRRSVSGNLHTMGGMITSWLCNTQSNVTLSVTEAEYQSMSKGLQEVRFSQMLIEEIGNVFYQAVIFEDNTGAIFLVKNQQVGARTKHIDVRHHFIREHHEKKNFAVKYVKSEKNESDILTKNTIEKILTAHALNIRDGTVMAWMDYQGAIETVAAAWKENVVRDESDESWIEVCRRPVRLKSSLRNNPKYWNNERCD
jgi:hypothetical protein